ncbi:MAG: ABC transporter permease [Methanosarcina sp.]|jgi:NitT/TauT family transport system permease protein|nr:ABC transporter permease [Methanosarcina sp.]MDD3317970.1 ABC transporter permease [Methanosarcina sp.]MDD4306001.1 ABC transporter permease [Methanosarcina sp.]MDD4620253.1 ABC transporter permease [Methanosarcina sp.]NLN43429.1 ABC transporter permease [Methanosarcina sp.]
MKKSFIKTIEENGIEALSLIIVIAIWQVVADKIVQNKLLLPSFYDVIVSFFAIIESGLIFTDTLTSLLHFFVGILAAFVIGIPLGIVMGWFKKANRAIDPIIEILRPIPPLAWIPFAIVWFGLTHQAAGFVVFVGMIFPIIINTYTGFKNVPKVYVEAAKVLGCTRNLDLIRHVAIPSAMPSIVAGIRIAMGVGWMCLVAAEMFGVSNRGLGYQIWHNYYLHRMDFVLVYMLLLGFVGLLIDRFFRYYVDAKLLKWTSGTVV